MTEVERIVKGLSEAQRRWFRNAWYGSLGWQINYRKKAFELGLTELNNCKLTPLGLQVRAYLEKETTHVSN